MKQSPRPSDLNKQLKRITHSRDEAKEKNREKNLLNQKLRDRNVEILESRDHWREKYKEISREKKDLEQQMQFTQDRLEQESKRAEQLQQEIEEIKKKPRFREINSHNG